MKSLKQQWGNLFSNENDDQLMDLLHNTSSLNGNRDLFDVSAEMNFANRYPSFNQADIQISNLSEVHDQYEFESPCFSSSVRAGQDEESSSNLIAEHKEPKQESSAPNISYVLKPIGETKI